MLLLLLVSRLYVSIPVQEPATLAFTAGGTVPADDVHIHAHLHTLVRRTDDLDLDLDLPPTEDVHPKEHTFTLALHATGQQFTVRAQQNDLLFAPGFKETLQMEDGSVRQVPALLAANSPKRHCHYIGTVEGDDAGSFAFSTCNGGMRGRLQAHGLDLVIQPRAANIAATGAPGTWFPASAPTVRKQTYTNHTSAHSSFAHVHEHSTVLAPGAVPFVPLLRSRREAAASKPVFLHEVAHEVAAYEKVHAAMLGASAGDGSFCGVGKHDGDLDRVDPHAHENVYMPPGGRTSGGSGGGRRRRAPPGQLQKYVEVLVVNDFTRISAAGGSNKLGDISADGASIMNAVTELYRVATWADSVKIQVRC